MIESQECYKVGDYTVPPVFKSVLLQIDANDKSLRSDYLGPTTKSLPFFESFKIIDDLWLEYIFMKKASYSLSVSILNKVMPQYTLVRGGIMFLKNGHQFKHQDPKVLHRFCKRIHIPVVTNEESVLCVNGNEYHLPENTVWAFDNITNLHWSKNSSSSTRIHFVFDVIDKDRLEFISKHIDLDELFVQWSTWEGRNNKELISLLGLEKEDAIPFIPIVGL
jgi:hypothetical protein